MATPIGNLRDITLRALEVLRSVDVIAAEDTRHTRHLLDHHGIVARLTAVHEHNERGAGERIAALLAEGNSVALVTDAGTPAVSDPGARAVQVVRAAGHRIVPLPGPSAVTAALSVAGAGGDAGFRFAGFLPVKREARRQALSALADAAVPVLWYEAPHRIRETVTDMREVLGADRRVVLCRELTKLFETVHECALGEAEAWLDADPNRVRGEFVLVLPPAVAAPAAAAAPDAARVVEVLARALPPSQAAKLAAEITGLPRAELYAAVRRARPGHPTEDEE